MQTQGDVDDVDAGDTLKVRDAGTLQLSGSRCVTHINPADSLLSIDKVHSHGLFSGYGGQPGGGGAAQCGAADVTEVGDQQHRQAIHRL